MEKLLNPNPVFYRPWQLAWLQALPRAPVQASIKVVLLPFAGDERRLAGLADIIDRDLALQHQGDQLRDRSADRRLTTSVALDAALTDAQED